MGLKYYKLFEAARLDIFDLAFGYSSETLNELFFNNADFRRKGIITRICAFLWHAFKSIAGLWQKREPIPIGAFIFFATAKNERDSLKPVCLHMPNAYLTGSRSKSSDSFPWVWAYAISCMYFPFVLVRFLKAKGYRKRSFTYVFDHYWLIYGLYIVSRMWLNRLKPKALILSNQLNTPHRVMLKAARDEGISTFYLQHASISEKFGPLTFDYALLEGYDALSKSARAGTTQTQIFLIGMPKHDPHFQHINTQPQIHSIGICTSGLDPIPRAEQLCARIRQEFPTLLLILRPHDVDPRVKEWKDLSRRYGMEFSDSKTELSFDFLKRVDAAIAGDSNILLEAALMDVFPLYYDFAQTHLDWYGFQRNGLVEYFSNPADVCRTIKVISQNKPSVRMKARRYCATIGTRYDGHSSELASTLIQELVSGNKVSLKEWKRIPNIGLESYEFVHDEAFIADNYHE